VESTLLELVNSYGSVQILCVTVWVQEFLYLHLRVTAEGLEKIIDL